MQIGIFKVEYFQIEKLFSYTVEDFFHNFLRGTTYK